MFTQLFREESVVLLKTLMLCEEERSCVGVHEGTATFRVIIANCHVIIANGHVIIANCHMIITNCHVIIANCHVIAVSV